MDKRNLVVTPSFEDAVPMPTSSKRPRDRTPQPPPTFAFAARWREELVCTAAGGSFILELAMGELTAYLPTQDAWQQRGPEWARPLWPVLHAELAGWCRENNALLVLDPGAAIF
jgi:hypothetical protein